MAVRFSREFVGTQFHPEADSEGMKDHFSTQKIKNKVIENFDEKKYLDMMEHLDDPDDCVRLQLRLVLYCYHIDIAEEHFPI